jgi:hypothetical protein
VQENEVKTGTFLYIFSSCTYTTKRSDVDPDPHWIWIRINGFADPDSDPDAIVTKKICKITD